MKSTTHVKGTIKLPGGKKIDFTATGVTKTEMNSVVKSAQPKARVSYKKKTVKRKK